MRTRRGLILIEMMATLVLMAVAAVLMTELFVASTKAIRNSDQRQQTAAHYEQMIAALRRDVGCSLALRVKSPTELEIDCGDTDKRLWVVGTESMSRSAGGALREWRQAPKEMMFEPQGRAVVLRVPAAAGDVVLASPALLAGELQR